MRPARGPASVLGLLVVLLGGSWADTGFADAEPVRIGVLAYRGKSHAVARWAQTAGYLSRRLEQRFEIVPLDLDEIAAAVNSRDVNFIITNPGNYVDLENRFGVSRMATMQTLSNGQPSVRYGSVILVRRDQSTIQNLQQLKHHSFMAVSPEAFGGFQMAWRELNEAGINPFTDFSRLDFVGFPQDRIIHALVTGQVDAGTVRAETLARMIENGQVRLQDFRILNPRATDDSGYQLSTRQYPEWPVATLKHTPRTLATQVTRALLSLRPDHPAAQSARIAGWTVPLDYSSVRELMQVLQIGPYEVLRQHSLAGMIRQNLHWVIAGCFALLCLIGLTVYISRTNHRLRETERFLREENRQRKQSQQALANYRDSLEQQVVLRTQDLRDTNQALEKSRRALRTLVEITSAHELSHEQKMMRLLDTGREYFDLPVAVLADNDASDTTICTISGDRSLLPESVGPLNQRCVSQIIQQAGEPLDVPDLRRELGDDSACLKYGWKTYLGTTVMVDGRVCCTLEFVGKQIRRHRLSSWDLDILKVMAQWIGDEIERHQAYEAQLKHQAELAHVSRMSTIGEMAASLAHELNQPLTGAINYSSACLRLLHEDEQDRQKLVQGMERAVEGANLAADIIRHIREFVHKGDRCLQHVDVNHVVNSVVSLMNYELRRHDIKLALVLTPDLPPVMANMIQLEQVVLNLVRNAIDAMDSTGPGLRQMMISTLREDRHLVIRVEDHGEGLRADTITQMFDAFYTTKVDGMGMGLSISRSIVESHQGRIYAANREQGGAEFSVFIPAGAV